MEELIKQAFLHVDVIGPHVQAGHYDLIGPNGEIVLPQVWDKVIEPDWAVTMHMWPMDRPPMPQMGRGQAGPAGMRPGMFPQGVRLPSQHQAGPPAPPHHPAMRGMGGMGAFRPQGAGGGRPAGGPPNGVPGVTVIQADKPRKAKKPPSGGVLGWIGGSGKNSKTKRSVPTYVSYLVT